MSAVCNIGDKLTGYREAGQGQALVLLHGIGGCADSWKHQFETLAKSYRVIAWDAPGYGSSANLDVDRPIARDYAARLAQLLENLGVTSCNLVGHSLGALMAASYARIWPERVRRLVRAAAAGGNGTALDAPLPPSVQSRIDELNAQGPAAFAAQRAPRLCADGADPAVVAHVTEMMSRIRPSGYAQACALLAQGDLFADLPAIAAPTLVMCGAEDRIVPPQRCRDVAAKLAGHRYIEISGAGHALYAEAPAAFDTALTAFLEGSA